MANKRIDELTEKTTISGTDLMVLYDMEESGSEKTKYIEFSNFPFPSSAPTVYEETLTSGTDTITLDFDHGDSGHAYVDGVRQKSSAYSFSGARDVVFVQTLPEDTEVIFEAWI
jgi:hypothetical protein